MNSADATGHPPDDSVAANYSRSEGLPAAPDPARFGLIHVLDIPSHSGSDAWEAP